MENRKREAGVEPGGQPSLGSAAPPAHELESFARHFFSCSICEISDDLELTLCPTGSTLQYQAIPFMQEPEDRAYLLHLADEYFNEQWHRRQPVTLIPGEYDSDDLDRLDSTKRLGRAMVEATRAQRQGGR